ncbi:MAG TPA: hypothetical protein VF623_01525, partial [Segetibacter sp.]
MFSVEKNRITIVLSTIKTTEEKRERKIFLVAIASVKMIVYIIEIFTKKPKQNMEQFVHRRNKKTTRSEWHKAFKETGNYRKYLKKLDIDPKEKIIAYSLRKEDIEALLKQGGKDLD